MYANKKEQYIYICINSCLNTGTTVQHPDVIPIMPDTTPVALAIPTHEVIHSQRTSSSPTSIEDTCGWTL